MNTKKLLSVILLFFILISLNFSCTKEEEVTNKPFSEIGFDDINAVESLLSNSPIEATNKAGFLLKPNDILLFVTNEGRFGKLKIVSYDLASNYDMRIDATVYKADKSILGNAESLLIHGTWLADLDVPKEATIAEYPTKGDFKLERVSDTDSNIEPYNGAKFYKYGK